uniref:Uncharacterized protein n=1 Tax=Leersia perrieri TaxID=77586 RepID=A0A0D9XMT8_9ORYZ
MESQTLSSSLPSKFPKSPNPIPSIARVYCFSSSSAMAKAKTRGRRPAPPPPPTATPPSTAAAKVVIDITSSPDSSGGKGGGGGKRAHVSPLDIDLDGIEMWTPRQKRRLEDDCCILAADPLAPNAAADAAGGGDDDDVAVVAERGKVACRDYPHPRSACAKFPFSSTPHDKHCQQCFCYVCDVVAPCSSWKKGQGGGHCNASDQDKQWKIKRVARQRQTQAVK